MLAFRRRENPRQVVAVPQPIGHMFLTECYPNELVSLLYGVYETYRAPYMNELITKKYYKEKRIHHTNRAPLYYDRKQMERLLR